jgi:hypothetical protein
VNRWIRRFVVALVTVHGSIPFLGAAEGFHLARSTELQNSMTAAQGVTWLAAGLMTLVAAVMMGVQSRYWWVVTACAAGVSQIVVLTFWGDAKAATLANVVMLLAATYGFLVYGPWSDEAQWERRVRNSSGSQAAQPLVTEADLSRLPSPLAAYLRASGAVGLPRVTSFYALVHGRIRSGPDSRWMSFTGKQFSTFGASPQRFFLMHAVMFGLPIVVSHVFSGSATMRARLFGAVPVMAGSGSDMTRAESVTLFNDLVVLAPAAIVEAPIDWLALNDHEVLGTYRATGQTVSAVLTFDHEHRLVNFVSDDRLRASRDGRSFVRQRWSTPIVRYASAGGRSIAVDGEARWHSGGREGVFTYLEFSVDGITYDPDTSHLDGVIESASQEHRLVEGRRA